MTAVLEHSPWNSPLRRAVNPKDWPWGNPDRDLLAGIIDELRILRVLNGNQSGAKPHDLPQPIPRPGASTGSDVIETGEATLDEIDRMLGW